MIYVPPGIREVTCWNIVRYEDMRIIIGWSNTHRDSIRSTPIVEQISENEYRTKSGSFYRLIGNPGLNFAGWKHYKKTFGNVGEFEFKQDKEIYNANT